MDQDSFKLADLMVYQLTRMELVMLTAMVCNSIDHMLVCTMIICNIISLDDY